MFVENGERWNTLAQGNLIPLGDVTILAHAPDVDVNQDVVGFEDGFVGRIVNIPVEDVAVGAPVADART